MGEVSENPFILKDDAGNYHRTPIGQLVLEAAVTDADGPVYAFYPGVVPETTIKAAYARLSRRQGDLRETLLAEFPSVMDLDVFKALRSLEGSEAARRLMGRVYHQFGDDSVGQLGGQHIVTERVSNIATKFIESGRYGSYLEQSTRYIPYDKRGRAGHFLYKPLDQVATNAPAALREHYEATNDRLFENYARAFHIAFNHVMRTREKHTDMSDVEWKIAVRGAVCDALRYMLPTATESTVGIFGSDQAIQNSIINLRSQELAEISQLGDAALREVRKADAVMFERTDDSKYGEAQSAYLRANRTATRALADKYFGQLEPIANVGERVILTEASGTDEDSIVARILFENTSQPLSVIEAKVKHMSSEEKLAVFKAYIGDRSPNRRYKPGRALEGTNYAFEVVCDYGAFRDLARHRAVGELRRQPLSPYLGHDLPELLIETDQVDLYEESLLLSRQLYEAMAAAGFSNEAEYAVLMGNLMRWRVAFNAREAMHLIELRTGKNGHPAYRRVAAQMYAQIAAVTPLIAEAMIHVDLGEDAELARVDEIVRASKRLGRLGLTMID